MTKSQWWLFYSAKKWRKYNIYFCLSMCFYVQIYYLFPPPIYYFKMWTEITKLVSVTTIVETLSVIFNDLLLLQIPYFFHPKQEYWQVIF